MKDRIYKFIGETVYVLAKGLVLCVIIIVISTLIVEKRKEEIWLEVVESFGMMYDTKEAELYQNFGIVDEENEYWEWNDYTHNIAYTEDIRPPKKETPEDPSIDPLADATIICLNKLMEAKLVLDPDEFEKVLECVSEQILSSQIILHDYMEYIDREPDTSPTKIVIQKIIVNCHIENTTDMLLPDYTDTLQCIRTEVERLNEWLDIEIDQKERERGI